MKQYLLLFLFFPLSCWPMHKHMSTVLSCVKVVAQSDPRFLVLQDAVGANAFDMMIHKESGNFLAHVVQGDKSLFILNSQPFEINDLGACIPIKSEQILPLLSPNQKKLILGVSQLAAVSNPKFQRLNTILTPSLNLFEGLTERPDVHGSSEQVSIIEKFVEFARGVASK